MEVLADGALGNADVVAGKEDGADLRGRASWQLGAERAGLVEQLGMLADGAQVGARVGFEAVEALVTIGAQPAIERGAGGLPLAAIRVLVKLAGQAAHEGAAFGRAEAWRERLGDDAERNSAMASAVAAAFMGLDLPGRMAASNPSPSRCPG